MTAVRRWWLAVRSYLAQPLGPDDTDGDAWRG